jgi:hypothetical protein
MSHADVVACVMTHGHVLQLQGLYCSCCCDSHSQNHRHRQPARHSLSNSCSCICLCTHPSALLNSCQASHNKHEEMHPLPTSRTLNIQRWITVGLLTSIQQTHTLIGIKICTHPPRLPPLSYPQQTQHQLAEGTDIEATPPQLVGCVSVCECALAPMKLMVLHWVALQQRSSLRHGQTQAPCKVVVPAHGGSTGQDTARYCLSGAAYQSQ